MVLAISILHMLLIKLIAASLALSSISYPPASRVISCQIEPPAKEGSVAEPVGFGLPVVANANGDAVNSIAY